MSTLHSLTYSEAERVGLGLKRRYYDITGKRRRPELTPEQWADVVQLVLRLTGDEIERRESSGATQ